MWTLALTLAATQLPTDCDAADALSNSVSATVAKGQNWALVESYQVS